MSEAKTGVWADFDPGSWSAVRRVPARRRQSGRDTVLADAPVVGGNGKGAGSGQSSSRVKDLAVGINSGVLLEELRARFDIGRRALAQNSLGLFVR